MSGKDISVFIYANFVDAVIINFLINLYLCNTYSLTVFLAHYVALLNI